MKSSLSFAKAWFAVSLLVLAFGYGFASHAWGLFPKTFVERAWRQAYWQVSEGGSGAPTAEQVYDRAGVHVAEPENVQEGMILVTSSWRWGDSGELVPGAKLLDKDGQTLHSWKPNRSELFRESDLKGGDPERSEFHGAYLLPDGDVVLVLTYIGAVRLNACGEVVWQLDEGNHHSVARAESLF